MADPLDQESGSPAQRRRRRTWTPVPDSATRPAPPADPSPPMSVGPGSLLTAEQREKVVKAFRSGATIHGAAEQAQASYLDVRATMGADPAFAVAVRQAKGAARDEIHMALYRAALERKAHGVALALLRVHDDEREAREMKRLVRQMARGGPRAPCRRPGGRPGNPEAQATGGRVMGENTMSEQTGAGTSSPPPGGPASEASRGDRDPPLSD